MRSSRRPPSRIERILVLVLIGFIAIDLLLVIPAYASELRLDRLHPSLPVVNLRPLAAGRARITKALEEDFTAPIRALAANLQQGGVKAFNGSLATSTEDYLETAVVQTATALSLAPGAKDEPATSTLIPSYTPTSTAIPTEQMPTMTPTKAAVITATAICAIATPGCATFEPSPTQAATALPTSTHTAVPVPTHSGSLPAFPGAEGFGADTVGGRGGQVLEVKNLNDSGPGSLRSAIEAEGPRIIVFRVGGTITLQSTLKITNPFITIAGQTAPGGGITLRSSPSYDKPTLAIQTHDVVIRYIRVRTGRSDDLSSSRDGIVIGHPTTTVHNVIIDHCSISWAADENVTTWYDSHDITIQWSIISEGLRDSSHSEGIHSMGMILGSEGSRNISVHHNLFAHNYARNPYIRTSGAVDIVNNVIYNPFFSGSHGPSHISNGYVKTPVNYIGNYLKAGVDSASLDYYVSGSGEAEIYVRGNITPNRPTDDLDEIQGVVRPSEQSWAVPAPHRVATVMATSAFQAYEAVLANAGVTLPMRDPVDSRIVNDVRNGTGRIIDDPTEVGGWPELATGTAPADSDHDGMPDAWESQYCLNPNYPGDSAMDIDGDGYTNVEEFLNKTTPSSGGTC